MRIISLQSYVTLYNIYFSKDAAEAALINIVQNVLLCIQLRILT